ncbi:MAG: hypothetical protein WKG00_00765 [Polyangiaceae bacterium]
MLTVSALTADALAQPQAQPSPPRAASPSAGDTCVMAYEQAQQNQRARRLLQARADLQLCQRVCPSMLTLDCDRWLGEVSGGIPTVILYAVDQQGRSLSEVRVLVDGAPLVESLDGAQVEVDPGEHTFTFEGRRGGRTETRLAVSSGERAQTISVRLDEAAVGALGTPPTATWVLGGVAAGALALGGVLAIKGHVDRSDLEASCAPSCSEDDVDAVRTEWAVAGVAAGVGAAAAIAALVVWASNGDATAPASTGARSPGRASRARSPTPRMLSLGAGPAPGGGFATLVGRF